MGGKGVRAGNRENDGTGAAMWLQCTLIGKERLAGAAGGGLGGPASARRRFCLGACSVRLLICWAGWIGLLGLAALGPDRASGQQRERAQGSAATSPAREAVADTSARYFFDDFSSVTFDRRHWSVAVGVRPTQDLLDEGQAVPAVQLSLDKRRAGRQPELCSVAVELAGVPGAELAYTVQHKGVEAGEQLVVEYLSDSGRWCTIERVVAADQDSVAFSRHIRALPEDALHEAFRVRFRPKVDDGDDVWYLGLVAVNGFEPMHALSVDTRPGRSARVEVFADEPSERLDGTTPFSRSLLKGRPVSLLAPPVVDGWVFSHWSVDGDVRADRQRMLTLKVREGAELVAHYRPSVAGRSEATVLIVSTPEPGVPIALGPQAGKVWTDVDTEARYPCLRGEWLALAVPARCRGLVFVGWLVNGEAQPDGACLLEHRVRGDDVLVAEYVLLGDMNGDGELDKLDVDEFVLALVDPTGYGQRYPELDRTLRGDINGDGELDALDVEDFVDILLNN